MSQMKEDIITNMKAAMKSGDKNRLTTLRLVLAAFKQKEIDERINLDDATCSQILSQLTKQRKESIKQFSAAGRDDLCAQEESELEIIREFLPPPLDEANITQMIEAALKETGATEMKHLGAVMKILQPQMQGCADMKQVSTRIRSLLGK